MGSPGQGSQGNWLPIYATLSGSTLVVADRLNIMSGMQWWQLPMAGAVGAVIAFLATLIQEGVRGGPGWGRILAHRTTTVLAAAGWATWADVSGWSSNVIISACVGTVAMSVLGMFCQSPAPAGRPGVEPGSVAEDRDISPRTPAGPTYQAVIRSVTKMPVVVTSWEPWGDPKDGLRLFVSLPANQGTTAAELAPKSGNIAAGARLPRGCNVRILDSDLQGVVVVDVMLRNVLLDTPPSFTESTAPASITEDFPVLTTPRGEALSICLRITCMIIGGTGGSGKTTLLHRIIMWLARCVDAVIWVVDLNGGGVADPWISPWAEGRASQPIVDWVADSEEEAAVMVAVARAIAVDRKANPEAKRRKREANTTVLPVAADMPAIVVLTDEGGEVRQSATVFGQLAGHGISRLAQIGRAEGLRTIMSVLRGTADLTDKALRVVTGLRLCLRMDEHDEYSHVLGDNPGKVELEGASGAGFLRTPTITRPVLGRTVNVDLAGIDRHAVATAGLRPSLDAHAIRAAAQVTARDVLAGREPLPTQLEHPAMQDAARGRAYAGRWDRYRARMREIGVEVVASSQGRGAEYVKADPAAPRPMASTATAALDSWEMHVMGPATPMRQLPPSPTDSGEGARIIQLFGDRRPQRPELVPPAGDTVRDQILTLVRDAKAEGISAADIDRNISAARSRVMDVLRDLRERGSIVKNNVGLYVMPERLADRSADGR